MLVHNKYQDLKSDCKISTIFSSNYKKNHNNDFFLHTILFVTLLQFLQLNTTNCHGWYQDKTGNPITDNILFISCNIEHCMRQYLKSLTSLPILGLKLLNRLFEMLLQFGKPWSPKHSLGFGQHCKSCFFIIYIHFSISANTI